METALATHGLVKRFGATLAVDNLDLRIPGGHVFGLVGPNGAGKTTAMSMICGLLRPDHGRVTVLGHDVWRDPIGAKAHFGVLPDSMLLFDRLSGVELLRYNGRLRGLPRDLVEQRAGELLHVLGLAEDANKVVADYSAGMTKKISLACALIHAPRLLILDEPLEAVDPVSGQVIRTLLRDYARGGGAVLLSSHVMELVENLCDGVGIMAGGRLLLTGTVAQVRGDSTLQDRFVELVGQGRIPGEETLQWLRRSSL
ncbi:ABC transporter ATP-binding protein [Arachnia propionica]|nr:ABC transporter ATP-binding protein [Arachnia propionica]MDO5081883.1 ABC transporter ATP-binding protein [Arachnia propionica]